MGASGATDGSVGTPLARVRHGVDRQVGDREAGEAAEQVARLDLAPDQGEQRHPADARDAVVVDLGERDGAVGHQRLEARERLLAGERAGAADQAFGQRLHERSRFAATEPVTAAGSRPGSARRRAPRRGRRRGVALGVALAALRRDLAQAEHPRPPRRAQHLLERRSVLVERQHPERLVGGEEAAVGEDGLAEDRLARVGAQQVPRDATPLAARVDVFGLPGLARIERDGLHAGLLFDLTHCGVHLRLARLDVPLGEDPGAVAVADQQDAPLVVDHHAAGPLDDASGAACAAGGAGGRHLRRHPISAGRACRLRAGR